MHQKHLSTLSPYHVCITTFGEASDGRRASSPDETSFKTGALAQLYSSPSSPLHCLFPAFCRCLTNVPSMRCLISVHISSAGGNNTSRLIISINKMYYDPSTANERKVCLANACCNDIPGAAVLLFRRSCGDGFLA